MLIAKGRGWESAYRDRWRHDKVVRSTHGVNCTGSCSWNVYVKDGLITWESQAVDYPQTDPERPNHEPRGCPRGASFSWYTYSPVRLKYPYMRGSLLERWRAATRHRERPRGGVRAGRGRRRLPRRARPRRVRALQLGGGDRADRRGDRAHDPRARPGPRRRVHADPRHVAGVVHLRDALPVADRRAHDDVLRLVRRPPARVAADVRRPDRRARVGGLVGRELHDRVGHQPADHAHPGRALHDRGALPRPEGRRRLTRLQRPRQVRRRLAARAAGHGRGARDGDGARDAQGVLGRPAHRRASRTTASASRTCRCSSRSTSARTARTSPAASCWRPTSARRASTPTGSRCCSTRPPTSPRSRTARSASATARRARAAGTSGWATSTRS